MILTDLRLQHFRSYVDASFEISPSVNIIVGPNASGKTNLLEAVLVVARGNSYRAKDAELVRFGQEWARLDADLPDHSRVVKLQAAPGSYTDKTFAIDNQILTRLTHTRSLPVVLFEPNDLLLLSSSPELRRAFLDNLIEQTVPGYASVRRHYRRVLAQRNNLLKKNPRDIKEQLFVWNIRLSELGGRIAAERRALVRGFAAQASELYTELAQKRHGIALEYASQFAAGGYETALLHKLEDNTEQDVQRGFTAYGPHRDDLTVLLDAHPVAETASRGETRTLVLALKILELQLLEATRGTKPLLLLDDVFSELDGKRRQALTNFVANYQTFITTTDADVVLQHFSSSNIIPLA